MRILSFGSLNFDYVYGVAHFTNPKETQSADSYYRNFGGKGLNQSIAVAKTGLKVFHAGKVGADGQPFIDYLQEFGVDTSYLQKDDTITTGHAIIEVCQAENRILLFGGANQAIDEAQIDRVLAHFQKGDYLVLQNEISCTGYLMRAAHDKGLKIFFNAAPMNEKVLTYPLKLVDILCVNEVEGQQLAGISCEDPTKLVAKLRTIFPTSMILLTVGSDGSYCDDGTQLYHVPAHQVDAVDTTAAGDTYSGFFLAGLCQGKTVKASMEQASFAAALAVQKPGAAASIPTMDEVLSGMKEVLEGQYES